MHVVVRPPLSDKDNGNSSSQLCLTFTKNNTAYGVCIYIFTTVIMHFGDTSF